MLRFLSPTPTTREDAKTESTAGEVKADGGPDDIRARAVHLTSNLKTLAHFLTLIEKDPAAHAEGLEDLELADTVAAIQDVRSRLSNVERDLTTVLGKRLGKFVGNLGDGRQFTVDRMADRKEWMHEEWKRDARRALVERTLDNLAVSRDAVVVDPTSGLETDQTLATILQSALTNAQEIHGSQAPRSRQLKALGLFATDYCTSTPGGWRFSALKPKDKADD